MIECLRSNTDTNQDDELGARVLIIRRALVLLSGIHQALDEVTLSVSALLQDLSKRKTVDGLLDLISLEGIYPSLSPGVGIPIERRVRSVLKNGVITRPSPSGDGPQRQGQSLLVEICLALDNILEDGNGLASIIQERTLVDLIAGFGELAFSPLAENKSSKNTHSCRLKTSVDRYVFLRIEILLPVTSSGTLLGMMLPDEYSKLGLQDAISYALPDSHFIASSRQS